MPERDPAITLYGIPNCDQVRAARRWLEEAGLPYRFHDFKRDGLSAELVEAWLARHPWDTVVNRRGTTWRTLPEAQRPHDSVSAARAVLEQPNLVKRPVVNARGDTLVGFDAPTWARFFGRGAS